MAIETKINIIPISILNHSTCFCSVVSTSPNFTLVSWLTNVTPFSKKSRFCFCSTGSINSICMKEIENIKIMSKARDQKQIYRLNETVSHWGLTPPPSQMRHLKNWPFCVKSFAMWKMNQNQGSFWRKNYKKFLLSQ